jgi:hypothetical protein
VVGNIYEQIPIGSSAEHGGFPADSQIDFQVEAMMGYFHVISGIPLSKWGFTGTESGWSNTQAITVSASSGSTSTSPTPTTTSTPTRTVLEFPTWIILPLFCNDDVAINCIYQKKDTKK